MDKTPIVLSATSGGKSIISFTSVIGIPTGIASVSFTLVFSSFETLMSQVLIDLDISQEELKTMKKKMKKNE